MLIFNKIFWMPQGHDETFVREFLNANVSMAVVKRGGWPGAF
jgi:hypothetical protein